jgi:hypothetical protein
MASTLRGTSPASVTSGYRFDVEDRNLRSVLPVPQIPLKKVTSARCLHPASKTTSPYHAPLLNLGGLGSKLKAGGGVVRVGIHSSKTFALGRALGFTRSRPA